MRILLLVLWLLIPVGAFAYHLGPGQNGMKRDRVAQILAEAEVNVLNEKWSDAESLYKDALELLPEDSVDAQCFVFPAQFPNFVLQSTVCLLLSCFIRML